MHSLLHLFSVPLGRLLIFLLFITVCSSSALFAQEKFTLSGTIRSAKTGETIIGANVSIAGMSVATNEYGCLLPPVAMNTGSIL
jgi:hypothetical protein